MRLYHNPRCSKSRQAVALLTEAGFEFEDYRYLTPGPLLSSVGLILFAQTNDLSQNAGFWLYLWAITGLLFFIGDYLLPGIITKRGGGSKEATRGATIGLLLGLITGPGMFIGAFVGAFIGQYRSNTNIVKR